MAAPAVQPSIINKELDHGTLEQIVQLVAARLTPSSLLPPVSESKLRVDVASFQPPRHPVASVSSIAAVTASGSSGSG